MHTGDQRMISAGMIIHAQVDQHMDDLCKDALCAGYMIRAWMISAGMTLARTVHVWTAGAGPV